MWVDGSYRGMYLLTEKIEADENRVNINTKNGDFLLETIVAGEEEEGNIYFTAASGQKFRLRESEKEEKIEDVKAKVDEFESIIASGTWEEISANLDVESFVSYYILNRTYISSQTFPDSALLEYANTLDIRNNPSLAKVNIHNFPNLSINYDDTTTLIDSIPAFSKHSIVLSGQIGVDFYVTIPEGINTDGAYAEFTVNGKTHQAMDIGNPDADILSEVDYVTLSDFALVKTLEGTKIESLDETGIKSLAFDLELESETTINIYLYPEESYTGSVNVSLDGGTENLAVKLQDGSYIIRLSGISAHLLGEMHTISVQAKKVFDVEISALSYAHNVLKSSSDNNLKKAVVALYKYYDSTVKYRAED